MLTETPTVPVTETVAFLPLPLRCVDYRSYPIFQAAIRAAAIVVHKPCRCQATEVRRRAPKERNPR